MCQGGYWAATRQREAAEGSQATPVASSGARFAPAQSRLQAPGAACPRGCTACGSRALSYTAPGRACSLWTRTGAVIREPDDGKVASLQQQQGSQQVDPRCSAQCAGSNTGLRATTTVGARMPGRVRCNGAAACAGWAPAAVDPVIPAGPRPRGRSSQLGGAPPSYAWPRVPLRPRSGTPSPRTGAPAALPDSLLQEVRATVAGPCQGQA